jgi:H-type lectin domain
LTRIRSGSIGVLQGTHMLFSDFADGGAMWTGHGAREKRVAVTFDQPFTDIPSILVGISMWDMDHKTNSRVDIHAEAVTITGFEIVFRTWGDSRIARIRAEWTAIGAVADDDAWDVP